MHTVYLTLAGDDIGAVIAGATAICPAPRACARLVRAGYSLAPESYPRWHTDARSGNARVLAIASARGRRAAKKAIARTVDSAYRCRRRCRDVATRPTPRSRP